MIWTSVTFSWSLTCFISSISPVSPCKYLPQTFCFLFSSLSCCPPYVFSNLILKFPSPSIYNVAHAMCLPLCSVLPLNVFLPFYISHHFRSVAIFSFIIATSLCSSVHIFVCISHACLPSMYLFLTRLMYVTYLYYSPTESCPSNFLTLIRLDGSLLCYCLEVFLPSLTHFLFQLQSHVSSPVSPHLCVLFFHTTSISMVYLFCLLSRSYLLPLFLIWSESDKAITCLWCVFSNAKCVLVQQD